MCQQTAMGLQIEQLYLQGMPKKIGKTVQNTLMKKFNKSNIQNIDNNKNNSNNCKKCSDINKSFNEINCTCLKNDKNNIKNDLLAIFTQWTRKICTKLNDKFENIQKTNSFKTLSKTTQPAHVIAVGILSFVLFAIWPNLLENNDKSIIETEKKSGLALVAYLGAFATHFGTQIWMTFVSGLSLYFSLPRHTFGLCQQILFPKYFALNSMLSIFTLIMYIKVIGGHWEFSTYIQVAALTICAVIEVTVRLYVAPPLLRLMGEKHRFEVGMGSGQEIGHLNQGDLIKCPHYQKIHKSFRRIHMTAAIGNMTVLICTFLHLNYLASKISVGV